MVWTLVILLGLVVVPLVIALVGYGVVRLAVRHELARHSREKTEQTV